MIRLIIISLTILFSISASAQGALDTSNKNGIGPCVERIDSSNAPLMILKAGKKELSMNVEDLSDINPMRIRKIEVIKGTNAIEKYNAKNGVVIIYPKRRFYKKIKKSMITNGTYHAI